MDGCSRTRSTASTVCRARGWPSWPSGSPRSRQEVRSRRAAGEYGFYELVDQAATVRQIKTFAEGLGQAYDHVLVLGIGGSALGTKALLNALRRPAWNEWDDEGREFFPRLTMLENVDPTTVAAALERIDPAPRAGQRDQQVGRHRGDDGAVPRGPRVAGARRWATPRPGTSCSPPIRRAAPCASWPAGSRSPRSMCRPRSAAASACSRRWACCRRRWSASTWRACSPALAARWSAPSRTTCCGIRPRSTPRCTGRPTPSSAPGCTC